MFTTLRILLIGALGAALALWLGVPAPFLTGPAFCVTLVSLTGLRAAMPDRLRDAAFVLIGANMGGSVTPETLATAVRWPGSIAILALAITAILLLGARLMQTAFGMDRMSALLSATPGHLSFVISLSSDVNADLARVTMIQSLRVLALTLLLPLAAPWLNAAPLPAIRPLSQIMPLPALGVILVLSVALGLGFRRLRLPAALLLGGMAVSSLAHVLSITQGGVPRWVSVPAFVTMGTLIGTRFSGASLRSLRQSLGAASVLTGFAMLLASLAAVTSSWLFGIPMLSALIAYAPGGLETMIAMSVLLDANPALVAAHHVFRLVFLTVLLPWAVARTRARNRTRV